MKINKTVNTNWSPFTISIGVESKEEADLLYKLFGWDVSIPDFIQEQEFLSDTDKTKLTGFMATVAKLLRP